MYCQEKDVLLETGISFLNSHQINRNLYFYTHKVEIFMVGV